MFQKQGLFRQHLYQILPLHAPVTRSQTKSSSISTSDWTSSSIGAAQLNDPSLKVIIRSLQASIRPSWQEISGHNSQTKTFWRMWDRLLLDSNVLYRTWYEGEEMPKANSCTRFTASEVCDIFMISLVLVTLVLKKC